MSSEEDLFCPEREKLITVEQLAQHDWIVCEKCHRVRIRARLDVEEKILSVSSFQPLSVSSSPPLPVSTSQSLSVSPSQPLSAPLFQPLSVSTSQSAQTTLFDETTPNTEYKPLHLMKQPRMPNTIKQQIIKKEKRLPPKASDRILVRDLIHLEGIDKAVAVEKLTQKRIDDAKAQQNKPEKEKVVVDKDQMPWSPQFGEDSTALPFFLPKGSISALPKETHKRYVAILSNFMNPDAKTRFVYNEIELKNSDIKLARERTQMNRLVIEANYYVDRFNGSPYRYVIPGSVEYIKSRIRNKLSTLSKWGYDKIVKELDWPSKSVSENSGMSSALPRKKAVLCEGKAGERFEIPNVRRKCVFSLDANDIAKAYPAEKVIEDPIDEDKTLLQLSADHGVEIVMNACTVRHLMTEPWPSRSEDFMLKINVRRHIYQGKVTRVVFVNKPIPASSLNKISIMRCFMKYVVKNGIRKSDPVESQPRRIPAQMRKRQLVSNSETKFLPTKLKKLTSSSEITGKLIIDEEEDKQKSPKKEVASQSKYFPDLSDDILGGILGGMNATSGVKETSTEKDYKNFDINEILMNFPLEQLQTNTSKDFTPSNKRYAIYSFDAKEAKRILVRSSSHGIDQQKQTATITSKVEYVPNAGAEKMSVEEILWNALTAIFKGADHHLNFYMHFEEGDCLQLVRRNSSTAFHMESEQKELLSHRSERLCKLIDLLHELDFGEYLLLQKEKKLIFYQEASQVDQGIPAITREKIETSVLAYPEGAEPPSFEQIFQGIDPHLTLVWHIIQSRIPGSFFTDSKRGYHWRQPSISTKSPQVKKKRNQRRKNPQKAKAETQKEHEDKVAEDTESVATTSDFDNFETMSSSTKSSSPRKNFVSHRGGWRNRDKNFCGHRRGSFRGEKWNWGRGNRNLDSQNGSEQFLPTDWDAPNVI